MIRAWVCVLAVFSTAATARAEELSLTSAIVAHIAEVRATNPELREDAFSKMGGSSVASKAFLHCFATEYVDLGDYADLAETIEHFDTGRRNSFNRQSEAAGVNWNLRYVLGGRPAHFRRELAATQARWALVLFGGNDAQNENERIYFTRLVYLVEQMTEMGVIPILGAALPRRSKYKDRWIRRFNLITEAVARHWSLPYIDYHAALGALPRKGLARDGVHPNVLPPGGLQAACQLTEEGLRYGNNLRNLLTLQMLDALRRTTPPDPDAATATATATDADADAATATDAATDAATVTATDAALTLTPSVPISVLLHKPSLPPTSPLPKNCGTPKPGARHHAIRFTLEERMRLRASALDLDDHKARILLVRHDDESGPRCVRRRSQSLEVDAAAGMWDLIVEVSEAAAKEGQILILVAPDPR
jgi:hypothetical protein